MSTYKERLEAEIIDLRDTLDAARRQREEEHRLRRKAEAKVARVEALAERMDDAGHVPQEGYDVANLIRAALARPEPQYDQANQDRAAAYLLAALAEPERDEEGA
jgi:hypothetical protein